MGQLLITRPPRVRESKIVLHSGFHAMDSGFLGTGFRFFVRGTWIPDTISGILESLSCIPYSKVPDSGFYNHKIPGLRNLVSLTWGEPELRRLLLSSGDPGVGPGDPPPSSFLDQTEARRAKKFFFGTCCPVSCECSLIQSQWYRYITGILRWSYELGEWFTDVRYHMLGTLSN